LAFFKQSPESRLQGFEDHLHLLVESSPEGMVICDTGDRVVFANAEFCRMFGWERQEVVGKFINDIVAASPEILNEASGVSSTVLTTPHVIPDTFRSRRDGAKIPVSVLAGPITDGKSTVGVYGIYRDISMKKRAEEQLTREKAFFENLFENAPEAIALCDREERVIRTNRAFTELFGFTLEEMAGQDLNHFVAADPELSREAKNLDAIAWSGGEPFSVDTWRTRKDGTRIPVKVLQFPFRIDQDTLVDYTIYRDRRADIRTEAALLQEKALFEKLFKSSPAAITLENTEGIILKANDAFYDMFGYSRSDEIIGKDVNTIIAQDPKIREEAVGMDRLFWSGKNIDKDVIRQRKDGSCIHLALTQTHFRLPDGTLLDYVIYRDIGDRIKAEQALRESERRYAAIVEDQIEMVCRFQSDGEVTFVNDAFCLFFSLSRDQIVSRSLVDVIGGKIGEDLCSGSENLCPECHSIFLEHSCVLPSGKKRWLRWSKRGIFDETGSLKEIQAVGRDTTEIKKTEEDLRHLNNVLQSVRGVNRLINRHHNKERLIQAICAHLIETRGYRNVWIGILGNGGKLATISEAGLGPDGRPFSERTRHGMLNEWGLAVLENPGISLKLGVTSMTDCPLLEKYEESGIMSTRLEHSGKVFGIISVSIPADVTIDQEEKSLFSELAHDISFALHAMEVEKDREEKSVILEGKARQLELLVRHHRDGLWEWNIYDGKVVLNSNYETALGHSPGEMQRSFKAWQANVNPEDLPGTLKIIEDVVSGRAESDIYETTYRMRTKDGGWKTVLDRGYVVQRDRHGRALFMVGAHSMMDETTTCKEGEGSRNDETQGKGDHR